MSRGGARAALTATVVTALVLLGAMTIGPGLSSTRRAVGWWTVSVLAGVTIGLAIRQRSRRADGQVTEEPAVTRELMDRRPQRAGAFQERLVLKDLMALFSPHELDRVAVLQGLAGVGKSQIVAEYARRARESGDEVVWVDASSRGAILRGLSRAAAAAIPGVDGRDVPWAAGRMLDWLDRARQPWLVVLDGLRDPRHLDGLWPPHTRYGRVVVTTELRDAVDASYISNVGPFERAESIAFLTESLARNPAQCAGAAELAEAVGDHPLVLSLAAAHIKEHSRLTCATYLAMFDDHRRALSGDRSGLPRDHWDAIARTLSLSIERANLGAPPGLVRPLLTMVSLLHAGGVPEDVFTAEATLRFLRADSEQDVRDTLSRLHRLNLITYDRGTVRVHTLVQRVVRGTATRRELARAMRVVADALVLVWPHVARDEVLGAALRVNALAARDVAGVRVWRPRDRALWFRLGHGLGEWGQAKAASELFQEVVDASNALFDWRSHFTLRARWSHAHWQGEAGNPVGAVRALTQLIEDAPEQFRFQRKLKLKARRSLARWLTYAKEPVRALAEANAVVDEFRRVFGARHQETLYALDTRAHCLAVTNHLPEAVEEMVELVAEFQRQQGPRGLDTLSARNNLASMRHRAGEHAAAIAEYTELLTDLKEVLGPVHPKTLCTTNNLGQCRVDAGGTR